MLQSVKNNTVSILPGLFRERMDVNRSYLMELDSTCLLQNFYLEAGFILPGLQVIEHPESALGLGSTKLPAPRSFPWSFSLCCRSLCCLRRRYPFKGKAGPHCSRAGKMSGRKRR